MSATGTINGVSCVGSGMTLRGITTRAISQHRPQRGISSSRHDETGRVLASRADDEDRRAARAQVTPMSGTDDEDHRRYLPPVAPTDENEGSPVSPTDEDQVPPWYLPTRTSYHCGSYRRETRRVWSSSEWATSGPYRRRPGCHGGTYRRGPGITGDPYRRRGITGDTWQRRDFEDSKSGASTESSTHRDHRRGERG